MINENILICGIVKNCEERITQNIYLALQTGYHFTNFKLIIYENNSTDNTKNILNTFSNDSNIKIIMENIEYSKIVNMTIL